MKLTRRNFNALGVTAAGAAMLPSWLPATAAAAPATALTDKPFHFAVVSDTHVIDKFYKPGSENGVEDNESILKANDRLIAARDTINGIRFKDGSKIENVFMPGDIFHNYPSADYDFYFKNETRIDIAKKIIDGFNAPVHLGFGNHDYDEHGTPGVSIAMSNRLIKEKLKSEPYSAVDYNGFRFVILNNFLGKTWEQGGDMRLGSLGEEQLQWAEAQFAARKPTVVFIHYPLWLVAPTEVKDFGLHPLLQKYKDTIQIVIAGHWHKWIDFAHTYGPQHTVTAATRYDPNAFMIFRADAKQGKIEWLDQRRVEWSTHFAKPYNTA